MTTVSSTTMTAHGSAPESKPQDGEDHSIRRIERDTLRYLIGAVMVGATAIAQWFFGGLIASDIAAIPAALGALLLAFDLFRSAYREVVTGQWSTATLASIAIIAAFLAQQYVVAGFLAFVLLVADQFVRQRAWGAERAIEDLVGLTPDTARVVRDGEEVEVSISSIQVGDVVRVRPGENLPVDGLIVGGQSEINQASLTGEAIPVPVQSGAQVYAGTTNITGLIDLRVTQVGEDTTIGKVSALIREAESSKTPRQLLAEQVARFFVPVALSVAFIVWFVTRDLNPVIVVLVVACPSALLLSSPLAMVASFAASARLGILIKETKYLEGAGGIDTVVFDKTGTLTTGQFAVSRLAPAEGVDGAELLVAAANGEQHSNHPLAQSILQTAKAARITPDGTDDFEEVHGSGIRAKTSIGEVHVGRAKWLVSLFPSISSEVKALEPRIEGMSGVHVVRDGKYLGVVGLEDKTRANTQAVVQQLRDLGVRRVMMLTGDRLSVAERVGRSIGVDQIQAECLPEEKHASIQQMVGSGRRVLMVGDGINDGPSLAAADVGVAMGLAGSDIAANSAGVALMNDDLQRIPFMIDLSRKTRAIIAQNIAASIIIALVGLALAAAEMLNIYFGAAWHFAGDLFVIANSFRLVRFGEVFAEGELPEGADAPGAPQGVPAVA